MKNISIAQYRYFHWYYLIRNDTHGCTYFRISTFHLMTNEISMKCESEKKKKDAFALNANLEFPYLQVFLIARRLVWKKVPRNDFEISPDIHNPSFSSVSPSALPRLFSLSRRIRLFYSARRSNGFLRLDFSARAATFKCPPVFDLSFTKAPTIGKSSFHFIISINASK